MFYEVQNTVAGAFLPSSDRDAHGAKAFPLPEWIVPRQEQHVKDHRAWEPNTLVKCVKYQEVERMELFAGRVP